MNNAYNQDVRYTNCPPNMNGIQNNIKYDFVKFLKLSVTNELNQSLSQRFNRYQPKVFPKKPVLKQGPPLVNNKPITRPALNTVRRDVPTVVFNNTVDNDANISSKVNVEKDIKIEQPM